MKCSYGKVATKLTVKIKFH